MPHDDEDLALSCDAGAFRPIGVHHVRWFDWDDDFDLLATTPSSAGETREAWRGTRERGFRYCGIVEDDHAVARAAVWPYSDDRWEVAAVWTREDRRRRGMAKSVVSFVTASVLDAGRIPTLHTQPTNAAMLRVAAAVGFTIIDPVE